jgi:hypothetical protein
MALDTVTAADITILDLERAWRATAGGKEDVIREELGIMPVRYYQRSTSWRKWSPRSATTR